MAGWLNTSAKYSDNQEGKHKQEVKQHEEADTFKTMTYCHTSCHRTWSIGEEHNGQTPSFTTISKPRIWFIMQECLKNKQIWTPHIGQSLSFKVIKQTVINGCSVVLSMNNYFNLHTTSLWSQPSWAIQWSATLKSISTVLPTWRHMICMLFRSDIVLYT